MPSAWMSMVGGLDRATALDEKTVELAYLAVLAALGRESGMAFHATSARNAGATRARRSSAPSSSGSLRRARSSSRMPAALDAFDRG